MFENVNPDRVPGEVKQGRAFRYFESALDGDYSFSETVDPESQLDEEDMLQVAEEYRRILNYSRGGISSAEDFIPEIAVELGLEDNVVETSYGILDDFEEYFKGGSNPQAVAAGMIYAGVRSETEIQGELATQEEVAEATEFAAGTVADKWQRIKDAYWEDKIDFSSI